MFLEFKIFAISTLVNFYILGKPHLREYFFSFWGEEGFLLRFVTTGFFIIYYFDCTKMQKPPFLTRN